MAKTIRYKLRSFRANHIFHHADGYIDKSHLQRKGRIKQSPREQSEQMCRESRGDNRNVQKPFQVISPISPASSLHPHPLVHACAVLSPSVVTPWTVPIRHLCPWDFFRQGILEWIAFPPPWDLPVPRIKPISCTSLHCKKTLHAEPS